MSGHADVVRNDWKSGKQVLVGHVSIGDDGVAKIDAAHDPGLMAKLLEPAPDRTSGRKLTPADGREFVAALSRRWTGDYVLVTEWHDEKSCPFAGTTVVAMQTVVQFNR